ncbi:TonB-dependent receptor family protein [Pseudohaliea rubra]|uniref:TonB-dependent receptor n=1 Tax=Pseudohaliea rubra DSM 19751 TaxID=1265313 RepID=A0A095XT75_9GAMM|nr:TonB-dependent receptor [Pseudohaliea rubra]KGE02871.1 TonB-dependent receptor [Pseudohaliea rubra DSM 19751]
MSRCRAALLFLSGLIAAPATASTALEEIIVVSPRLDSTVQQTPFAITAVTGDDLQLGRQQIGIDEALARVPGVFFQNRYNLNQDLRIAIRGFGARAQFGQSGIRLAVDDIPLTTPDGTSQVDDLDMGSMGRIEVLRGPSAALFGTAAGGAINIYSEQPQEQPTVETRATVGDYGQRQLQLKASGTSGDLGYLASVRRQDLEGFRDHSQADTTTFNSTFHYRIDPTLELTAVFAALDKEARDPGALTPAELAEGPRDRARQLNVDCGVRETADQYRTGVVLRKSLGEGQSLRLRGYLLDRQFDARLPCPFVDHTTFDRRYIGGGLEYQLAGTVAGRSNRFIAGMEVTAQEDDRERFDADRSGNRGALTQRQREAVDSVAIYLQDELTLSETVMLRLSGRYEALDFKLSDEFLEDGDNSGAIQFDEFTPMAGLLWSPTAWANLYANLSTSFETPSLNQLEDPAGPGFLESLEAQTSTNYEVGVKGLVGGRLSYELALFRIDLEDELVPFETAGDVFFRNAGSSTREGLELAAEAQLREGLRLTLAYSYNDFRYDRFRAGGERFDGNMLPGVPESQLFAELAWTHSDGWYATWDLLRVGELYADDANSPAAQVDGYTVSNLRLGRRYQRGRLAVSPYLGINNLFDEAFFANVRVNQTFNRFIEPAPGRNFYGGIGLSYRL